MKNGTFKSTAASIRLHGIALAAIPSKNNPDVLRVVCTPLSVSIDQRDTYQIDEQRKFDITVNSSDPGQLLDCFTRVTDTIEQVVGEQKEALAKTGFYRPVVLYIGQDSLKPVRTDDLAPRIFGTLLRRSRSKAIIQKTRELQQIRDGHFQDHPELKDSFEKTNDKLSALLKDCNIEWGNYFRYYKPSKELFKTEMDEELQPLIAAFKNGTTEEKEKAKEGIKEIARKQGRWFGRLFAFYPRAFTLETSPVRDADPAVQAEYPRFNYLGVHPDFEAAFRKEFDKVRTRYILMGAKDGGGFSKPWNKDKSLSNRRVKLPHEAPAPFFVDPCADAIRDQLDILCHTPGMENRDSPAWKGKIIKAAKRNSGHTSQLTPR